MSTTSNAFKEHAIGDVKEDLPLTENEDFSIVNEKGDNVIDPRISLRSPLDELISRESGKLGPSDFNDTVQSSASTTIIQMEREDSERSDSNKQRHTESMENDISFLPSSEQSIGSGLESDIEDNDSDSDMTQTPTLKYDPNIDNNLPETVALLTAQDGGKVYLIGTAHFSIESNKDVAKVIQMVQPHMVMVELCSARIHILQLDENTIMEQAKNISFQSIYNVIKQNGAFNGLMYILLLNMSARLTKELGMAPGGEFRTAFVEAKKVPKCMVHLGDRPINITIQRALNSLTWWQTLKMGWHLLVPSKAVTLEEVERLKRRDFLEEVLAEMAGEFPALRDVFINERDIFLTYSLQLAALSQRTPHGTTPCRVVAVVGIGHMAGIIENWRKVKHSQIPPILRIPPLSLSTKILRFTVKASLLGTVLYVVYKIIPLPSGATLQSIKSSVEGLLKHMITVSMKAKAGEDHYVHLSAEVMYVESNIPGPGVDIDYFESEFIKGCSCEQQCLDCCCTRGSPNYIDGRIRDEKIAGPVIECNSYCKCRENCGNRLIQSGPLDCLHVAEASNKGLGLFTKTSIKKGQFICEYAGEVLGSTEAIQRIKQNQRDGAMNYVLMVSEHVSDRTIMTCIDPKYFGNIGRYCNHSCQPTATLVPIRVNSPIPHLCLFASKDIDIGEEITFDYGGGMVNSVQNLSKTPCLCGASTCLHYLPHHPL